MDTRVDPAGVAGTGKLALLPLTAPATVVTVLTPPAAVVMVAVGAPPGVGLFVIVAVGDWTITDMDRPPAGIVP